MSMAPPLTVRGTIRAPGDKSISHRALIFAAMADGPTRIRDILSSADVHATASALRAMGVDIPALSEDFVVRGRGLAALHSPESTLDCANSGTTTRLLAGLIAGLAGREARFEGDASLSRGSVRLSVGETVIEDLIENRLQTLSRQLLGDPHAWRGAGSQPRGSFPLARTDNSSLSTDMDVVDVG